MSTVFSTQAGGRASFTHLPDIVEELQQADLTLLSKFRLAYFDCYVLFGDISLQRITFAIDHGVPVIANRDGSPPLDWLIQSRTGRKVLVLQTRIPEKINTSMHSTAAEIADLSVAEHIVVTTRGHLGAIVINNGATAEVTSSVPVKAVQGAGSVFSAAPAMSLLARRALSGVLSGMLTAPSEWCANNMTFSGQCTHFEVTSPPQRGTRQRKTEDSEGGG